MPKALEIAIQAVKPGQDELYSKRRAAFLDELKKQDGVENDWTFRSFFTMPEPDETTVNIGVTRWRDLDAFQSASETLMPTEKARAFFETVDLRAFVQMHPEDGKPLKLEDYIDGPEQVLEVAVRKIREGQEKAFWIAREAFFGRVAEQPGFLFERELIEEGSDTRAMMIAWRSKQDFQRALGVLAQDPTMPAFMETVEVTAYQAGTLLG